MGFKELEKQLCATAKAFGAFKAEFGYGKSGKELLKPFFRSLEESLGAFETEFDFLIGKDTVNIDGKSLGARAEAGDTIIFDVSVKYNGRWSDVCRTFFVHETNDFQKSVYKLINSTISVGKAMLKGGTEAGKIYEAVNDCYEKSGKTLVHHAGHLIDKTPIAEPRFIAGEKRKVKSGNVCAIESGLYDGFGIRLENDFYLSESGAEDLFDDFMPLADPESYIIGK